MLDPERDASSLASCASGRPALVCAVGWECGEVLRRCGTGTLGPALGWDVCCGVASMWCRGPTFVLEKTCLGGITNCFVGRLMAAEV